MDAKKKSTTSTEVKRRYNAKMYATVRAELPKELVNSFKALAHTRGDSVASILRQAIERYLSEGENAQAD